MDNFEFAASGLQAYLELRLNSIRKFMTIDRS